MSRFFKTLGTRASEALTSIPRRRLLLGRLAVHVADATRRLADGSLDPSRVGLDGFEEVAVKGLEMSTSQARVRLPTLSSLDLVRVYSLRGACAFCRRHGAPPSALEALERDLSQLDLESMALGVLRRRALTPAERRQLFLEATTTYPGYLPDAALDAAMGLETSATSTPYGALIAALLGLGLPSGTTLVELACADGRLAVVAGLLFEHLRYVGVIAEEERLKTVAGAVSPLDFGTRVRHQAGEAPLAGTYIATAPLAYTTLVALQASSHPFELLVPEGSDGLAGEGWLAAVDVVGGFTRYRRVS